ncbi:ArsR/SmtB family transcription factor [Fontivita pretiosa]|uniref:ArsR/SmtB family transcription factor n=1 Tax=Fontivita pretiosa TaxID=2989684 RepID=UPI003D17D93A
MKELSSRATGSPARKAEVLVGWMDSLADRTRLRLLRLLERHELGVAELCEVLQLPQSTVSRHLKLLRDQGWVRSRRSGTTHLYRMILDELEPAARKLWLLAREQTEQWATVRQDELRLQRRLRQRAGGAEAFFAGAAARWDKLRRQFYGESFTTSALLALIPRHYTVADLGCGTGQVAAALARHVKHVIGVDSSGAMLRAARRRLADQPNVALLRADLGAIPLADQSCDAAMLILVLSYIPEIAPVLSQARRILKPRGRLVIVDLLPHDRDDFRRQMGQVHAGLAPEFIQRQLCQAGFSDVQVQPLSPEPSATGPALFLATARR